MGYIYIFTNPWMPDLVKIGITDNLEVRLKQSAGTEGKGTFIPCAFSCYYAVKSDKNKEMEDYIHTIFNSYQINKKREFFEISPEDAKTALQGLVKLGVATELDDIESKNITDKVNKELDAEGQQKIIRKSRTTFKLLGIPVGSELVYKADNTITCKTADDLNNVSYKGEIRTISNVSNELTGNSSNGYLNFIYNGRILSDIRDELEAKNL